jgi:hypothetical protein
MINLEPVIRECGGLKPYFEYEYDEVTKKLNEWHGGEPNKHGSFEDRFVEMMAEVGKSKAEVRLAMNGRKQWLTGYGLEHSTAGAFSGPSVWNHVAFESKEEGIIYEARNAIEWFKREIDSLNSCTSKTTRAEAAKMVVILQARIDQKPQLKQMDLFG